MKIEYFYVSLEPLNIKEIWDYIWHHQAYYIKIYEQLHQKPLSLSCIETDLFWHERYMAGCSLRLMRRPWRFLLDVILWNNTCQLLPDPRRGGRFSRSSCHLSAKAHLSLHITTWSVLTGLTGRPASLAQWEPGEETAWGHHLWCWDLIITEVMKMCTPIETLLNKFMEQALLCLPPPRSRLPLLPAKCILFPTKAYSCPYRENRGKSPPPHTHTYIPGVPQYPHSTKHAHRRTNPRRGNKLWTWEKMSSPFNCRPWLFSAEVPCYQILKLYWLGLAWKSDFIVGLTFDLGFCSVWGRSTAELPGLSCGELMREFTVEVGRGETINGRPGLDSPRKPRDCALQPALWINTLHESYYRSRPFGLQSRLGWMWL